MAYRDKDTQNGDPRPRLSREEIAAKRTATQEAMAEARALVGQLVEFLDNGEVMIEEIAGEEGAEYREQRFVREMALLGALHEGGTFEKLAHVFAPGEEMLLSALLAAGRKASWYPKEHFSWSTPKDRKADGTTFVEVVRQNLTHVEWEKLLGGFLPKASAKVSDKAMSWKELMAPSEGKSGRTYLQAVATWAKPAKDAKPSKGEAFVTAKLAAKGIGKLGALLGRKAGMTASKVAEAPAPAPTPEPAKKGLKAKLGGGTAKATKAVAKPMSDAELGAMVSAGKMSLNEALELSTAANKK